MTAGNAGAAPETLARPLAKRLEKLPRLPTPIEISSNIPDAVIAAAVDALARGETHYTDRPGILPLRKLVCDRLRAAFGVDIPPTAVTITCGTTEARFVAVRILAKPDTQIIAPAPDGSMLIRGAAHLLGAHMVNGADDPGAVSVVYLTPADDRYIVSDLLEAAKTHGWPVIWDMSAAAQPGDFHPAQDAALLPRTVTIDGLSDSPTARMPGWRVGWVAGSEFAEKMRSLKQSMTICTTSVSQWAAVEMLK